MELISFTICIFLLQVRHIAIDVGTGGGALGTRAPQDLAINKEVPSSFEKMPLFS